MKINQATTKNKKYNTLYPAPPKSLSENITMRQPGEHWVTSSGHISSSLTSPTNLNNNNSAFQQNKLPPKIDSLMTNNATIAGVGTIAALAALYLGRRIYNGRNNLNNQPVRSNNSPNNERGR